MGKSNISNGYIVFDWMTEKLGLSKTATLLYAIIFDASMQGKRAALFSTREAAAFCKASPQTITANLHLLHETGLLDSLVYCGRRWKATVNTKTLEDHHIGWFRKDPDSKEDAE